MSNPEAIKLQNSTRLQRVALEIQERFDTPLETFVDHRVRIEALEEQVAETPDVDALHGQIQDLRTALNAVIGEFTRRVDELAESGGVEPQDQ